MTDILFWATVGAYFVWLLAPIGKIRAALLVVMLFLAGTFVFVATTGDPCAVRINAECVDR